MHESGCMDTLIALSLLALVATPAALAVHHVICARRDRHLRRARPAPATEPRATAPTATSHAPAAMLESHSLVPRPWSVPPPCLGVHEVDLPLWDDEGDAAPGGHSHREAA